MRPLVLIGGGGHCASVIDVAESADYKIHGVLDLPENVGAEILGYPIIGTDDDILRYARDYDFVITVGQISSSHVRRRIYGIVGGSGGKLPTIVAADAHVSPHALLDEGCVIMHKAVVGPGASIGKCGIINTLADIEHNVSVGDFCHISTSAVVNGDVRIGSDTFIGSGSVIHQGVSITEGCVIGAGSTVSRDHTVPGVYRLNEELWKKP